MMSDPGSFPGQADWSSFSALSWNMETRLLLGNCIDILYRTDAGMKMSDEEAAYLTRVSQRLAEGSTHGQEQDVEAAMSSVMVSNTALDAFGPEPEVAASTLTELAVSLAQVARARAATPTQVDDLTERLIRLHSTLFNAGAKQPDDVVLLDHIA